MEKLDMQSPNWANENCKFIAEQFPNCITETAEGIKLDFDLLKQELSSDIVEGNKERYRLEWPGKREAIVTANLPTTKTLRPVREDSVDFDNTENLYIEGDNLEVLKLLQESYLGKIKMIYIDPPYNTGKDFIYKDNFNTDKEQELIDSGQKDEYKQRLVANPETAGRYHSDWLSMMYPRLKLARNLLTDDGAIFISIDDNEVENLKKICDEILGETNFRNYLLIRRRVKSLNVQFANSGLKSMNVGYEYVLVYSKTEAFSFRALRRTKKNAPTQGVWNVFWSGADRPTMRYEILGFAPTTGQWRWSKAKAIEGVNNYNEFIEKYSKSMTLEEYWEKTERKLKFIRRIKNGIGKNGGVQYWIAPSLTILRTSDWTDIEVSEIHKEFEFPFQNPKSTNLIKTLTETIDDKDFIILDFFSGSATSAHAIIKLNASDNGSRKFIQVQIPESIKDSKFDSICEIGKERICRAAKKIKEETGADIDYGFRVYRLDESNMQDVYYKPQEYKQEMMDMFADNVKPGRTPDDLLAQVMLDWGLPLSLKIEKATIVGKQLFKVAGNSLYACFDKEIDEEFAKEIAKEAPLRIVFRDSGFINDTAKVNVQQLLKQLSPETEMKVI